MNNAEKVKLVREYIAESKGATVDRWGHVKFSKNNKEYRYKFMKNVFRFEVKVHHDHGAPDWVRIKSYNITDSYRVLKSKKLIS